MIHALKQIQQTLTEQSLLWHSFIIKQEISL